LRFLEGLLVKLWKEAVSARGTQGVATGGLNPDAPSTPGARPGSGPTPAHETVPPGACSGAGGSPRALVRMTALALVALALLAFAFASAANANEAQTILEKCGHHEPFSGYSQKAYREALKQMTTTGSQYSECENEIRKAEEAAAGGGSGTAAGTPSASVASPLTPAEQHAVQSAHRNGSTPVQVGSVPVRPGVVHADIASAVSTLPHSLFAVLALMAAGAVVLAIGEVRKRVRSGRDS
jgi:hypothetical protein